MADAPFGARSRLLLHFKSQGLRLVVLSEAVGRLRVDQIVFMAVRSARRVVSSLSNVVWSLIGCPSSKGDRSMLSPVGKFSRRKIGSIRGTTVRKARSTESRRGSLGRRFATRPAVPMPLCYQSCGAETITPCARVGSSPRDGGGRPRGTNTLRLLSKCCGRRLPVRLAFIFRNAVQVRNQPKRCFAFVPRCLNGQAPGVYLLGRGIETRTTTASQRPSVGLGKAWSIQVRCVFRRPAAPHADIVSHPPELGKVNVAKSSGVIASAISWNVMSIRAATRAKLSPVEQSAPGGRSPLAPNRKAQAV